MNVHLIGIGGVGMAGLAVLLKSRGHDVSGCDAHLGSRTRWLESLGIAVAGEHDPQHVANADLAVVTPAVHPDSPERQSALGKCAMRGEVLAKLVGESPDSIVVCGSHGKTTTATWIAKLLIALGEGVEWCIGGETGDFPVAGIRNCEAQCGSRVLVVEADESDGTLADYRAKTLVVTNCEYDHPDHFKTRAEYVACFDAARRNAGCTIEGEALPPIDGMAWMDGLAPHNRKNARTAVEVALGRGHRIADIANAMEQITTALPDRRFQRIADGVYADYAHHPTEMKCAIGMARKVCGGRLRVLFQPHRYSRTKALLKDFPAAFEGADEVVLCPTYAAFEPPVEGGGVADLYAECRASGVAARWYLARSCGEAWEHARNSTGDGDVTLILGAGDIIEVAEQARMDSERWSFGFPRHREWIGGGTNTVRSDLNLSVDYVKSDSPAARPGAALGVPWMAGVPGTVGGWVKMNAGAFGHSISEVLKAVKIDGEWVAAESCGFGYRTSNISGEIQDVELKPEIELSWKDENPESYLKRRHDFPAGTKGSVFCNPPGDSAGRLLEAVGAKSMRVGGACVWEKHANVIVAGDGATASDFIALAQLMRERVRFRLGIDLRYEVVGLA